MNKPEKKKLNAIIQLFHPDILIADVIDERVDSALDYLRLCVLDSLLDLEATKRELKQIH